MPEGFALDDDGFVRTTCEPLMDTFPVADVHNIGYDAASCGTGTCETSCPDAHANSDWGGAHHGIDVFAYQGAPLVAVADGEVRRVGVVSATSGLRVRIRDACGWEYYYGHLDQAFVQPGDIVRAGDLIGTMGRTGTASTHLHFNVSPEGAYYDDIDPFPLLQATSGSACDDGPVVEPEGPEEDDSPPTCGTIGGTTWLEADDTLWSCDGRFVLVMQQDGNLVLYMDEVPLWHSGTHGHPGSRAVMQGDGNLVVYGASGAPLWHAGTHGHPGARLDVQDDGNLVITGAQGGVLWHSGTWGH
ncbi:MAG: peptidoglycan DD-metalloendopeptidase family protein [Myxococcales bacterium]|nr:peptidoglycan DD-metalloendopeptidase family protein [Myxococcales bacterium]